MTENTPVISDTRDNVLFWSVMIPTYNRIDFLGKTLTSVLDQDPGPASMQIEVIDNCSQDYDVITYVKEIAGDRVTVFRQEKTVDFQENWNTCIRRSIGKWVHILHDDDMVLPGFYQTYQKFIDHNPDVDLVFCQSNIINERDEITSQYIPDINCKSDCVLKDPLPMLISENFIPSTSAVVKKQIYNRIGGFSSDIMNTVDWNMWIRIAQMGHLGYVCQPLLAYRVHSKSGSLTQDRNNELIEQKYKDIRYIIEKYKQLLPKKNRSSIEKQFRKRYSQSAHFQKKLLIRENYFDLAGCHAKWAYELYPTKINAIRYYLFKFFYKKYLSD